MVPETEEAQPQPSEAAPPEPARLEEGDLSAGEAEPEESELDRVKAELEQARAECADLEDRRRRSQADFENVRKRLQRDKEEQARYAAFETIKSLLPIVDDFERALAAECADAKFREGVELIHRRIFDVFSRAGLREVSQHETFDSNLHYAVDRAPATEDQQDNQILSVYQKGYFFKDRLMRESMVKVAVKD